MIVRRYGSKVQSVTPNFDSRAMTEVGFVRGSEFSMAWDEFSSRYRREEGRDLTASADGAVQGEVEDALLETLRDELTTLEASLDGGRVLLVENEAGVDFPKTRGRQLTAGGEGRTVFEYTVDPPLRIGIYVPV